MEKTLIDFYDTLDPEKLSLLKKHLQKQFEYRKNKKIFGIVFDMLHECNLRCRGCGTDASFSFEKIISNPKPSFDDVISILLKIRKYADTFHKNIFLNIGGGEPFLRNDIHEIIKLASQYFGVEGVGIDTNGSIDNSYELIEKALPYISYIGISINGLEDYHNWWSGNSKINAFKRSTDVIRRICENNFNNNKIEITSVATKRNIKHIPKLMRILAELGVKNYSVHRAMPVGRMKNTLDLIPSANEYLQLLVDIIVTAEECGLNAHLHHSIESIHATLLLGLNTYAPDKIGNPDLGSSIGIEPNGTLVFDPWCTMGVWKTLTSGNLLSDELNLTELIGTDRGTVLDLAKIYTAPHLRCNGCKYPCSGGSRIAAAANELGKINEQEIKDSHILSAMTAIDPACPLFIRGKNEL